MQGVQLLTGWHSAVAWVDTRPLHSLTGSGSFHVSHAMCDCLCPESCHASADGLAYWL